MLKTVIHSWLLFKTKKIHFNWKDTVCTYHTNTYIVTFRINACLMIIILWKSILNISHVWSICHWQYSYIKVAQSNVFKRAMIIVSIQKSHASCKKGAGSPMQNGQGEWLWRYIYWKKNFKDNSGKFMLPPPSFSTNQLESMHLTL